MKEERRPELEGRVYVSPAVTSSTPTPAPRPATCQYSHGPFLLEALPLGSTGGSGRQDVQEDTHLGSGEGCERTREQRHFTFCLALGAPEALALPKGDL